MTRAGALSALAAAALAAGCEARPPDLFAVERSGSVPGARLSLVVSDNGIARCNRGPERRLPDGLLFAARQLARDLEGPARRGLRLPPQPGSVLAYRVRLEAGTVAFADNSRGLPPGLRPLQGFTRTVATRVCGLPR